MGLPVRASACLAHVLNSRPPCLCLDCFWLRCNLLPLPGGCFSRPGLGPAADCPFLIRQERSDQRRRPECPRPSASLRATCVVAVAGFAVKLSSRCALRSNITASQITKQSCPSAGLQPRNRRKRARRRRGHTGRGLQNRPGVQGAALCPALPAALRRSATWAAVTSAGWPPRVVRV